MALTEQQQQSLLGVTSFMFDYAPDQASYDRFASILEQNPSFYDLGTDLAKTDAFQSQYDGTTQGLIDLVFNRLNITEGTQAYTRGTDFITQRLEAGVSEGQVLMEVGEKLLQDTPPEGLEDAAAILQNKIAVSQAYLESGTEGYSSDTIPDLLSGVTADEASVQAAQDKIDAVVNEGETFTLTADVDDRAGTANDDTFTAGLTVAGTQTLQDFDTIEGGEGTDTLNATLNGVTVSVAPTLTDVENIYARSVENSQTLDLGNATGVEQVWNDRSQTELVVDAVQNAVTIGAQDVAAVDANGDATADYTVTYDTDVLGSDTANQDIVLDDALLAKLDVNVAGNDAITTASIALTGENEVATLDVGGTSGNETLHELTLTGEGSLTVGNDQGANVIDASGVAGNVELTLAATANDQSATAADRAVTLGAGDDMLDTSNADIADIEVDGGEGNDTLIVDGSVADLTDSLVANVSNFEALGLSGLDQKVGYQTLTGLGFGELTLTGAAGGSAELAGLTADSTVTLKGDNDVKLTVAGAGNADDTAFSFATEGADGSDSDFTVTVNNVQNLTVSTADADADVYQQSTLTLTDTALENLTVTGDEAVVFDGSTGFANLETVDVSGVTAASERADDVASGFFVSDEFASEITVSDQGVAVTGSAGADLIQFDLNAEVTGGEGDDVFAFNDAGSATADNTNFATITDFQAGDNIVFGDGSDGDIFIDEADELTGGTALTEVTVSTAPGVDATFDDYLNAAADTTNGLGDGEVGYFEFDGNTYVASNTGAAFGYDGSTNAVTGDLVELTGSVDLSDFAYGTIA